MALKQKCPVPSPKNLAPSPPTKGPSPPRTTGNIGQSYSPSLVQFSYDQKPPRFTLDLFSMIRLTLIAATFTGIPLCVVHVRLTEATILYFSILKLIYLIFSLVLSILDLVQFHFSKLPHRLEAMLDLLLAFSFLTFFVIGVVMLKRTTDTIYFVVSGLHFITFFSILRRAHRISEQLRHLSSLKFHDVEKEGNMGSQRAISVPIANNVPSGLTRYGDGICARHKAMTETITAIRSPCAELEGSNRWTIISGKAVERR